MRDDNPDTIAIEDTHWVHTEVDDVFLPSVRVQLGWKDVEAAVESGAVVPQQAHALWAAWAAPTSGLRVGAQSVARGFEPTQADLPPEPPAGPGVLQRHGLAIGLVAGLLLGAAVTGLALGG